MTDAPKKRRVVSRDENPEPETTEDRTRRGWPGVSSNPFIDQSYYQQFPERFRPRFETAGTSENLTREEQQKIDAGWQKPIEMITIVNVSDKPDNVTILGLQPGEILHLKVPACGGIVRGPLRNYLHTGLAGSKFSKYLEIGPSYAALREPTTDREEAARREKDIQDLCHGMKTGELRNGDRLDACMLFDCPVEGHTRRLPSGELESLLSLRHYQYAIEAIGQTLTVKDGKTGEDNVLYTPEYDAAKKQLDTLIELDNRPHAQMFAMNRQYALEAREADIKVRLASGKFVTGR